MEEISIYSNLNVRIRDNWVQVLAIILVASILRAAITSVGPIVDLIKNDLLISNTIAGLLTTIPLLLFGIVSPFVPRIVNSIGIEWTVFYGLIIILVGILVRTMGGIELFLLGTALLGIGIAVGNVTIPGLVKLKFPLQVGLVTGLYGSTMNGMAGVGGGLSVPLSTMSPLGYKLSLSIWGVLVVVAILFWMTELNNKMNTTNENNDTLSEPNIKMKALVKSRMVWSIAMLFAMQSMVFYCIVAWLPSLLVERGLTPDQAGYYFMFSQFLQIPIAFFFPQFVAKVKEQTIPMFIILGCFILGFSMLFIENKTALLFGVLISGAGIGAAFSACMTFFSVKARTYNGSIALSGFSQSIGYILAAIGPLFMGFVFDLTESWNFNNFIFLIMGVLLCIFGLFAAKDQYIEDTL
nr:MFS transporter [Jeotgalicoccus pinnipedialis]